jgi:MraZ protein
LVYDGPKWTKVGSGGFESVFKEKVVFGQNTHSVDPKGRVNIPIKFREKLGETFYLVKNTDQCLDVFPAKAWEELQAKIKTASQFNKAIREYQRLFISSAVESSTDRQGRVLIPQNLREFASIEKDVMIAGLGERLEIWSLDKWNERYVMEEFDMVAIAEELAKLGV